MKIALYSDLHLEFGEFAPCPAPADIVVLAGDTHTKGRAVKWAKERFSVPVIVVAGNHDFYGGHVTNVLRHLAEDAEGSNVHFLHRKSVVVGGIRFIGATLWSDYAAVRPAAETLWLAKSAMNDYKKIRAGNHYGKLRPEQCRDFHFDDLLWLKQALVEPFAGPTVVVTHHAPSLRSVPDEFREDPLTGCYATDLEYLFGSNVAVWCHGHIHACQDYEISGTRVLCNPRGYAPDDLTPGFAEPLVFEI